MKTLYVLLLPVNTGSRKFCELVENETFERNILSSKIELELGLTESDFTLIAMSDIMDNINNDEITFEDVFISYLYISK